MENNTDKRDRRAVAALRILAVCLIWIPQPFVFLFGLFGGFGLPDWYGFLGVVGIVSLYLALLIALSRAAFALGRDRRALRNSCVFALVAAGILVANHFYAASQFVDPDEYDSATASQLLQAANDSNLKYGQAAYRPFTGEHIARLSEPGTLAFAADGKLPHVDSATALLPLASAFVTATYPQSATTVQWELGDFDSAFIDAYATGYIDGSVSKKTAEGGRWDTEAALRDLAVTDGPDYAKGYKAGYNAGFVQGYRNTDPKASSYRYDFNELRAEAAEALRDEERPVDAVFQYNNSTSGFTRLADGRTDVFFGTKADADQAAYAASIGVDFEYAPIGREGFVFIVNAGNPVDSITVEQAKGIYSGRITNWRELGGNDEPIVAYQRNENSGSQSMMRAFMGDVSLMRAPAQLYAASMGGLVSTIANYDNGKGAIGYSFRYYVTDLVDSFNVKVLAIDGIEASLANISTRSYPITGEFYAVTRAGDESAELAAFIDWIRGPQGQELVKLSGYAPLAGMREASGT